MVANIHTPSSYPPSTLAHHALSRSKTLSALSDHDESSEAAVDTQASSPAEPYQLFDRVIRTTDARAALRAGALAVLHPVAPLSLAIAAQVATEQGLIVLDPALLEQLLRDSADSADTSHSAQHTAARKDALSPRENEVLKLIADGQSNKQIAATLRISENTVKFHSNSLMKKLGVQSRTEAVVRAARLGVLVL
jgi:DNA-binding NarL/FixJ family response regulator